MTAEQPSTRSKVKLKTECVFSTALELHLSPYSFVKKSSFDPLYTGGSVAATSNGRWLFTTLSDDVVITDVETGSTIAHLRGDSLVTTLTVTPTAHDAIEGTGTLLVARRSLTLTFHSFPGDLEQPLKTIARAHDAPILTSAADSTGSLFATGAADGSVKVWDAHQGHMTHVFRGHANIVTSLVFDVDTTVGRARLASASEDGQVRVWDLHQRKPLYIFKSHNSAVTALSFTPDATRLLSGGRDGILLTWDVTAKSNVTSRGASEVDPASSIPVFETIEAAGIIRVGPKRVATSKGKAKADDGQLLAYTAGSKGYLRLWDLVTGRMVGTESEVASRMDIIRTLHLPVTGEMIIVYNDHNIEFRSVASYFNPNEGTSRHVVGYNDEVIDTVLLSIEDEETETHLAVATNSALIRIYDLAPEGGFGRTQLLEGHSDVVLAFARSNDGRRFISGSKDNTARLWEAVDGRWACIGLLSGHLDSVGAVALADDYIATASGDQTLKLWPLLGGPSNSLKLTSLLTQKIHEKDINALAISSNGRLLASGSQDKTARLFSVGENGRTLTPLGTFTGHKRGVWSVRFSPVDKTIVTASGDRTIKMWSITDFTCLKTLEGHTNSVLRVEFITFGQQLVTCASDGLVKVWNVRDEACVATLDNHEEKIWALAISRDETTIVSGAADSVITFWRDVTAEVQAAKAAEAEELVIKNQDYENFVLAKDFRSAFLLALSLDQPRRLHGLISGVLASADRQPDTLTGHATIDAAVQALQPEMVLRLLSSIRAWNAVTRTADVAQVVLHAVLTYHSPRVLLNAGLGGDMLDALLPYTERHYARVDRLLAQESYALDFLLESSGLLEDGAERMEMQSNVGR